MYVYVYVYLIPQRIISFLGSKYILRWVLQARETLQSDIRILI